MRANENGFCLKMMPCECGSDGTKVPDLSYEEQEAGFRDEAGDKVYFRTINIGSLNGNPQKVRHGITGIKDVIELKYRWKSIGGNIWYYGNRSSASNYTITYIDATDVVIHSTSAHTDQYSAVITIFYTCTDR